MMETVDIIRDLLKTVMKGQKGEEKKKRPNEERDKEGRSKDRWTCCGEAMQTHGATLWGEVNTLSSTQGRILHRNRRTHLLHLVIVCPLQTDGKAADRVCFRLLSIHKVCLSEFIQGWTQPQMLCWRCCLVPGTRILRIGPQSRQIHLLKIYLWPKRLTALRNSGKTQTLVPTKGPFENLGKFILPFPSSTRSLFSQVTKAPEGIAWCQHRAGGSLLCLLVVGTCDSGI